MDRSELHFVIDDQLLFETLLMEIRGLTISNSSHKVKERNNREQELILEILNLKSNLSELNK